MRVRYGIVMGSVLALGLAGCAAETATPPPPTVTTAETSTATGGSRKQAITVRATVEKIDVAKRLVTLKLPDGSTQQVRVGAEARNLPQVQRGDDVIATYYRSVAFQVVKPGKGKPAVAAGESFARAEEGEKPGAVAARTMTMVAEIVALDREHREAVLRGPEGNTVTVEVQNPANFDKVKVGDTVEITLAEAFAIDVQPAPKKR